MKQLLIMVIAIGLLSACGSDGMTQGESQEATESNESGSEPVNQEETTDNHTEDVIEFADTSNNKDTVTYNFNDYKLVDTYTTDSTEDGFNTADFGGFEVTYSFAIVENPEGEQTIAFIAETMNNTEDTIQYNADMTLKTSEGEQLTIPGAFGSSDSGMKNKGMATAELQYDVPESFELTLEPPLKDLGDYEYEEGHYGEPITESFSID